MIIDQIDVPNTAQPINIKIHNTGKTTDYISTLLSIVPEPGHTPIYTIPLHSAEEKRKAGIYLTPNKIKLEPGQTQLVRLGFLPTATGITQDKIYHLQFIPVYTEPKAVVIAQGVLIILRPAHPNPNLDIRQKDKILLLKNSGNTNLLLLSIEQCQHTQDCIKTDYRKRLYASQQLSIPLKHTGVASVQYEFRDKIAKQSSTLMLS